jgi:hypothetical protein
LSENLFLPLSPEAMTELRMIQSQVADIQLTEDTHDSWTCAWGSKFTSQDFYQFCFKNLEPNIAFSWI